MRPVLAGRHPLVLAGGALTRRTRARTPPAKAARIAIVDGVFFLIARP